MRNKDNRNFSIVSLLYLVIMTVIFVISVIYSEAGLKALKDVIISIIENFDLHLAMKNLLKMDMSVDYQAGFFTLSMIQVTFISRLAGRLVNEETYLDKIFMFLGNICLSCFLNITYALYSIKFLESVIGAIPMISLLIIGLIYGGIKTIQVIRNYEWGAYMALGRWTLAMFVNPVTLAGGSVIVLSMAAIMTYSALYDTILHKNIILLIVVVAIISFPLTEFFSKLLDTILDKINGDDIPIIDIGYGIFSILLIVGWFIFMVFKTEYTDITFDINSKTYTYKTVKTIDRGIEKGNWWWGYFKDGTLLIDGNGGSMSDYGLNGSPWYEYRSDIKKIILLEGTHNIGSCAFCNMNNVEEIYIPKEVNRIGNLAFSGCSSLKKINVDRENSFYSTEEGNLYDKTKTTLLKCPGGKEIIEIPETVQEIKENFAGNSILKEINVSDNNQTFSSIEGVLYNKDLTKLIRCPIGKKGKYAINAKTKQIESYAFAYCRNLENVIFPNKLEVIGHSSFESCSEIKKISIPVSVKKIKKYAFAHCGKLEKVIFQGRVAEIDEEAFLDTNVKLYTRLE